MNFIQNNDMIFCIAAYRCCLRLSHPSIRCSPSCIFNAVLDSLYQSPALHSSIHPGSRRSIWWILNAGLSRSIISSYRGLFNCECMCVCLGNGLFVQNQNGSSEKRVRYSQCTGMAFHSTLMKSIIWVLDYCCYTIELIKRTLDAYSCNELYFQALRIFAVN